MPKVPSFTCLMALPRRRGYEHAAARRVSRARHREVVTVTLEEQALLEAQP